MSVAFVLTPLGTQLRRMEGKIARRAAVTKGGWGEWCSKPVTATSPVSTSKCQRGAGNTSPSPGTTQHPEQPALGEENEVEEGKVFQVLQELSQRMELGMQSGKEQ